MPLEKTDLKYIWDMLDAARTVQELVEGKTFEDYASAKWLRLAVERAIEIIGEAARRVSREGQAKYAEIPWQPIVASRHIIAHEYGDIEHDKIWRMATVHVPPLICQLAKIIEENPPSGA